MSYRWLKVMLAMSSLAGGTAGAMGPISVVEPLIARDTRIEVTTTQGLASDSWVLVEPGEGSASWPRELVQVQVADEWHLDLMRPLEGVPRAGDAQVSLLPVTQESKGNAPSWLDSPRQHVGVSAGGALPVEGAAPHGTQVLVFVDGVEAARLESDASGRFAGTVEMPREPGSHQVQVLRALEGVWTLHSEPVTVVSLAAPPPPVVDEPVNGSFTNNPRLTFRGSGQAGTRVTVAIGGVDVASTDVDPLGNWSVTLGSPLAEGAYTARVRAQFPGDVPSTDTVTNFTVDMTPPDTTITSRPSDRTTETTGLFNFQSGEFGSRYECSFEGSPFEPCSRPYTFSTPLADGPHVFAVRSIDRAGNVDPEPARVEWIVDTVPPTLEFVTRPPAQSNAESSTFVLRANEEVRNYQCVLDGVVLTGIVCGETSIVEPLTEGSRTFTLRVTDLVGLSQEISYTWNVDLTPPGKPALEHPMAGDLLGPSAPAISGTAEPGATVRVIIGGSERCSAPVDSSGKWSCSPTVPLTTNPSYELSLEVRDAAGNVNNQFTPITFAVDVDAPDTFIDLPDTFTSGEDGLVSRTDRPVFGFRSTEEGVTYECRLNDVLVPCEELTTGSRQLTEGGYTLQVVARDRVGNVDPSPATQAWTFTIYVGSGGGPNGCSASGASPLLPLVPLLAFLKRRRSRSSRTKTAHLGGVVAALVALLVAPARAQGIDLQQYKPAPGSRDVLGVYSPEIDPDKQWHAGVSINYAQNPLVLRTASDGGFTQSIVSGQLTADVVASFAFARYFELGLALPVTTQWGPPPGELDVFIPNDVTGTALGNVRVVPKAVWPVSEKLNLGLAAVVSLPRLFVSSDQGFLGSGAWGVQPMLLGQWGATDNLRLIGNVGVRLQSDRRSELLDLTVGNELTYAVGAQWSAANNKPGLFVQGSLEGTAALGSQTSSIPLELLVAVGHSFQNGMSLRVGGGPGLTSGYGTPNYRVFGSIDWVFGSSASGSSTTSTTATTAICMGQPDKDDDQDTVANKMDQCPYVKGDPAADGCPNDVAAARVSEATKSLENDALDKDGDGVPNYADACSEGSKGSNSKGTQKTHGCPGGPKEFRVKLIASKDSDATNSKAVGDLKKKISDWAKGKRISAVDATLPTGELELVQTWFERVHASLPPSIQGLKIDPERKGTPVASTSGKASFEIILTLWSISDQGKELSLLKCANAGGVAARLLASHGQVTSGSENKPLANGDLVCVGESVKTGPESGAVLVLVDDVIRLAANSQVTPGKSVGESQLNGTVEFQGNPDKALAGPKIDVPCEGPVVTNPPSLKWMPVPNAKGYLVQVSKGGSFVSDVRFVSTGAEGREVNRESLKLPAGTWFWRVLPVNDKGFTGQPSTIHSFEVVESTASSKR